MGCAAEKESGTQDRKIEENLKADKQKSGNVVKTLILGTGESGKSTFVKQLRIILDPAYEKGKSGGYSSEERSRYAPVIVQNVYQALANLQDAMDALRIKYERTENSKNIQDYAHQVSSDNLRMSPEDATKIKKIWNDKGIQNAYNKRSEFQLADCCKYFMESLDRIGSHGYTPNNDDIVHCRMKTTGILEYRYNVKGTEFMFIDVGGQRAERRKWIHSFEIVTSVIFLASLSDYDLKLAESKTDENRMRESLKLFEYIANHNAFQSTLIIVFLNKRDLFEEKFSASDFDKHFPEFKEWRKEEGQSKSMESCLQFIEKLYTKKLKNKDNPDQKVIFHKTVATNTSAICDVFNNIKQELIASSLRKAGLL
ncbi:guanine nucleotide-binding protein subunit alpha-14-like [Convolutriloba macropyga]|uniref:guanine nucleotide-binding protein subunit alpha-14-like n=1 Tax=Convolutriloba macropyga TaxID=536237 RepID=UPI003F523788